MSAIMEALKQFEATEANLAKLERLWSELQDLFPRGLSFGAQPEYQDRCRSFLQVLRALPAIDGWKPDVTPPDAESIGAIRFDLMELGDPLAEMQLENSLWAGGDQISEYRFRFDQKRRALIRDELINLIAQFDTALREVRHTFGEPQRGQKLSGSLWDTLCNCLDQIEVLLGSSMQKPNSWSNLKRHLKFAECQDLHDIEQFDWPNVKRGLEQGLYGENEPLPVSAIDLADLVAAKPRGPVTVQLQWSNLTADGFERLLFTLITNQAGYENPEWLMQTKAPDRGRDLSVTRVIQDPLAGTRRERVIIQCKHWLSRSVSLPDATVAAEQTKLWGAPKVDVLVLATSGRFTTDAVQWVERHNSEGTVPRIEMWAESHLEHLLASRPALIADFKLR
ncbi:restriction endonuclease [Pseudochelatococcus sp. G4_1912]|uniref:restriction endonuclease n=1 Tax=Pseudochelatococcus sp. G4_1912 TaxID=3114288 RepID=UPI0039C64537